MSTIKLSGRVDVQRLVGKINLVPSENAGGPLQAKTVYPSHSEQTIAPDEDYYGLAVVKVMPVPRVPACVASVREGEDAVIETLVNLAAAVSVELSDLEYKAYRLTITDFQRDGSRSQTFANMAEFALYDSEGNNLARLSGATYSANNYYSDTQAPSKAFDGDVNTNWHSNWRTANTTNWLQVDLITNADVVSFGLTPHNEGTNKDYPVNFTLSESANGTSWTVIAEYNDLTSGWSKGVERLFTL